MINRLNASCLSSLSPDNSSILASKSLIYLFDGQSPPEGFIGWRILTCCYSAKLSSATRSIYAYQAVMTCLPVCAFGTLAVLFCSDLFSLHHNNASRLALRTTAREIFVLTLSRSKCNTQYSSASFHQLLLDNAHRRFLAPLPLPTPIRMISLLFSLKIAVPVRVMRFGPLLLLRSQQR